jgi:hypothetical protein
LLDEDWKKSPKVIYYKSSADAAPPPSAGERSNGFSLESDQRTLHGQPVTYQLYRREVYAGESPFFSTVQDTVFLQQLIQGGALRCTHSWTCGKTNAFSSGTRSVYRVDLLYLPTAERPAALHGGSSRYKGQLPFFLQGCKTLSFKNPFVHPGEYYPARGGVPELRARRQHPRYAGQESSRGR